MQKIIFFRPSQLARTKNGNESLLLLQSSRVVYKGSQINPFVWHRDTTWIFSVTIRALLYHAFSVESIVKQVGLLQSVRKANGFELR